MRSICRGHRNPAAWSKRIDVTRQGCFLDPPHEAGGTPPGSDPPSRPRCRNRTCMHQDYRAGGCSIASPGGPRPFPSGLGRSRSRCRARACREPNAHGIFQCCRSHDCTYLLVSGRQGRHGPSAWRWRGACGLNESRPAMTAPRARSGNSPLPPGRCLFQHRRLLRACSNSIWHAHHAVAETLHLELTNVASPFAFALLLAYQLVTLLLRDAPLSLALVFCAA
jgi:hypothetical protein